MVEPLAFFNLTIKMISASKKVEWQRLLDILDMFPTCFGQWIPAYLEVSGAQVAILGSGVAKGISEDKFGKIPPNWSAQQIICSGLWVRVLATPELDDHGQTGPALRGVHYEEYMPPGQAEFTSWKPRQVKL